MNKTEKQEQETFYVIQSRCNEWINENKKLIKEGLNKFQILLSEKSKKQNTDSDDETLCRLFFDAIRDTYIRSEFEKVPIKKNKRTIKALLKKIENIGVFYSEIDQNLKNHDPDFDHKDVLLKLQTHYTHLSKIIDLYNTGQTKHGENVAAKLFIDKMLELYKFGTGVELRTVDSTSENAENNAFTKFIKDFFGQLFKGQMSPHTYAGAAQYINREISARNNRKNRTKK